MISDDPHRNIPNFLSRDTKLARYILSDGPVLVPPSVWLGTEGPRDTNLCRGIRDVIVRVACCYRRAAVAWSFHPRGLLLLGSNNLVALLF